MTRNALHRLKGVGYLTSSVSVFLLAAVSWSNAQKSMLLTACLVAGAAASIIGMFFRWLTYEIEDRKNRPRTNPYGRQPDASAGQSRQNGR